MKEHITLPPKKSSHLKLLACHALVFTSVLFGNMVVATTFDIPSIFFKEKSPSIDGAVEDSLSVYAKPLGVLKDDALAIPTLKDRYKIRIVGYTDNKECAGDDCRSLSLRRAQLIYKWLLAHGVSSTQLLPPEGRSADDPVGDNSTSTGRASNRRVEFQWIPVSARP